MNESQIIQLEQSPWHSAQDDIDRLTKLGWTITILNKRFTAGNMISDHRDVDGKPRDGFSYEWTILCERPASGGLVNIPECHHPGAEVPQTKS